MFVYCSFQIKCKPCGARRLHHNHKIRMETITNSGRGECQHCTRIRNRECARSSGRGTYDGPLYTTPLSGRRMRFMRFFFGPGICCLMSGCVQACVRAYVRASMRSGRFAVYTYLRFAISPKNSMEERTFRRTQRIHNPLAATGSYGPV